MDERCCACALLARHQRDRKWRACVHACVCSVVLSSMKGGAFVSCAREFLGCGMCGISVNRVCSSFRLCLRCLPRGEWRGSRARISTLRPVFAARESINVSHVGRVLCRPFSKADRSSDCRTLLRVRGLQTRCAMNQNNLCSPEKLFSVTIFGQ